MTSESAECALRRKRRSTLIIILFYKKRKKESNKNKQTEEYGFSADNVKCREAGVVIMVTGQQLSIIITQRTAEWKNYRCDDS